MKNFKYYILSFFIGIALLFGATSSRGPHFLTDIENENRPDYQSILINNCPFRTELAGEIWLGNDMVSAFKKYLYDDVDMIFRDERKVLHDKFGVQIYIRGYYKYEPPFPDKSHINILYMLYPLRFTKPNQELIDNRDKLKVTDFGGTPLLYDEVQFFDAFAVGAKHHTERLRQAGFKAYYVPQFTNPQKFYPDYDETLKSEVLFVGNRRFNGAPIIALNHGLPITIYGTHWGDIAKGGFIDNSILRKYYSSAKIVLNDHRFDMKAYGFINNRTFDVTACGTLLISDYIPEIEEIYGDSIPMWKTEEELVELIKYYLDPAHEKERLEKAKRAQKITLENFTTEQIAKKFGEIIEDIKKDKGIN